MTDDNSRPESSPIWGEGPGGQALWVLILEAFARDTK